MFYEQESPLHKTIAGTCLSSFSFSAVLSSLTMELSLQISWSREISSLHVRWYTIIIGWCNHERRIKIGKASSPHLDCCHNRNDFARQPSFTTRHAGFAAVMLVLFFYKFATKLTGNRTYAWYFARLMYFV